MIPAGDVALRHDIQLLADRGLISGPVSTWPLAWAPILSDLEAVDAAALRGGVADSLARVRERARWETRTSDWTLRAEVAIAEAPTRIRSFRQTPRGEGQLSLGASYTGDRIAVDLNVQGVDADQDDDTARADGSMIGITAGNWSISANTYERWWGPGWDGSLILSNNARPIPAIMFDRMFTDPFETRWLSWLGPWDLSVIFGQLERERTVPNAQFFGMRFAFKPVPSVEIGLSRSAQWCGDDRPCGADTFIDLLLGKDNVGDAGVSTDNEPGNQLGGLDVRWTPAFIDAPVAIYGQFIGEDEAGGLPSRYIGQGGVEMAGYLADRWSWRGYLELAATSCQFHESSERFNCAYNHGTYRTGYRYRSRAIGHGADNDARVVSAGFVMVDAEEQEWSVLLRFGALNRGGAPDDNNTLTPTRQDFESVDIVHRRSYPFGIIEAGLGYETIDDIATGRKFDEGRGYLLWRSSY